MYRLAALWDKDEIKERVTRLFVATDRRDWSGVVECLAEKVWLDMPGAGVAPEWKAATAIAQEWERALAGVDAVHHQIGNFLVRLDEDGRAAETECYGIATHYRAGPDGHCVRTFVGDYAFRLTRQDSDWRIERMRFNLKYVSGDSGSAGEGGA